jgi:hypothetical protein
MILQHLGEIVRGESVSPLPGPRCRRTCPTCVTPAMTRLSCSPGPLSRPGSRKPLAMGMYVMSVAHAKFAAIPFQKVGIDRMARMRFRETGFPLDRLNAPLPHEGADMASADLVAFIPQCIPYPPRPQGGLILSMRFMSSLSLMRTGT